MAAVLAGRLQWSRAADLLAGDADRETLAYYLSRAGRFREAERILEALVENEARPDLLVNLGVARAGLGNDDGAVEAYRRALALDPERLDGRVYLANALLRLGRRDEAASEYRRYLDGGASGESAERVRRVLAAMGLAGEEAS